MPQPLIPNICDFLSKIDPFDKLPDDLQRKVAESVQISFLAKGELLPFDLEDPERFLYIIRTGSLEQRKQNGVLRARLGPEDLFGFTFLETTPGNPADCYNVTALDNSLLYQVPHSKLKQLLASHPQYATLFATQVQARLQSALNVTWSGNENGLFVRKVSEVAQGRVAVVDADMTIQDVAREMRQTNRSSTAVILDDGNIIGIITDRDMTLRVVAEGVSIGRPVREVMTPSPLTIEPDDLILKAVSLMMEHNVRSLPVVSNNRVQGLLTTTNLVQKHRVQAIFLIDKIQHCETVNALAALSLERQAIFEALVEGGVRGEIIGLVMAMIMDAYSRRLIQIAEQLYGTPPCDFVWVAAGSQARNEVHMLSDQDNAIILADHATHSDRIYFNQLAMYVCNGLACCGYPLCSGGYMAAAPKWCQPLRIWQEYYQKWITNPEYDKLLNASVFLELRPIYGRGELCATLQSCMLQKIAANPAFVRSLTRDSITVNPPLGIFKNLVLEKTGDNTKTLNIKRNVLTLIVDLARIYGLSAGCDLTGTEDRFTHAYKANLLSEENFKNIIGAYHFITQVRFTQQLAALKQGRQPNNRIDPNQFGSFERKHLKDAFRIIADLQDYAKLRFTKE